MNETKVTVFEKEHGFNKGGFSDREKFPTLRGCSSENYKVAIRDKSKTVRGGAETRLLVPSKNGTTCTIQKLNTGN